jgi:hypothetical protein
MIVNEAPWIHTGEINPYRNPWVNYGRYQLSESFSNEFLSGLRDAVASIIGASSFRWIPIDDMQHSLVEISLPPVRLGRRFFHGLVARITMQGGRPCCNILDPWGSMKRGDTHLHPHIGGSGYALCHNSNDINSMLRSGNYIGAVVEMVGKVSTFTPGGEYRVPPGVLICKESGGGWECSSRRRASRVCHICNEGTCQNHFRTCEICRSNTCFDCVADIQVEEACITETSGTVYVCNNCAAKDDYVRCRRCELPSSRAVECAGCGSSVAYYCAVHCEYHAEDVLFCQDCARRSERETANRWGCYECCPRVEDGGLACEYVGHRNIRRTHATMNLVIMRIDALDSNVSVCPACIRDANYMIGASNLVYRMLQESEEGNE